MKKRFWNDLAIILASLCIILGGAYTLFKILDGFNPLLNFLTADNFFTKNLSLIVSILAFVEGIVVTILVGRQWNREARKKKHEEMQHK